MESLIASLQISREEMLKRVAHFKDLIPNDYKAMKRGDSVDQNMLTGFTLIGRKPSLRFLGFSRRIPEKPADPRRFARRSRRPRTPHSVSSYTSLASMSTATISPGSLPLLTHA
jgi:hypothetical protein